MSPKAWFGTDVLSPTQRLPDGVAYDDLGTQKAMIVLTGRREQRHRGDDCHNLVVCGHGLAGDRFRQARSGACHRCHRHQSEDAVHQDQGQEHSPLPTRSSSTDASAQKMYRECATSSSRTSSLRRRASSRASSRRSPRRNRPVICADVGDGAMPVLCNDVTLREGAISAAPPPRGPPALRAKHRRR